MTGGCFLLSYVNVNLFFEAFNAVIAHAGILSGMATDMLM
jgi:hypothetical protein